MTTPSLSDDSAAPAGPVGVDGMLALCQALGISATQLHALADILAHGEPTVEDAFLHYRDRLPSWRKPAESVHRLLSGQPEEQGPGGSLLPAVDALGPLPVRRLNDLGDRHITQVRARVGAAIVDADRARGRIRRPTDARDNGHGAAQHSLDLIVGLALEVERQLHIPMPVKDLKRRFAKRTPTAFSEAEIRAWEPLLRRRRDAKLDRLVIELALASGARRGALCSLRLRDLDLANCRVQLRGKGKAPYWVPVPRSLLVRARSLALERGAARPTDSVLLRVPGREGQHRPITTRYFDCLWDKLGQAPANQAPHTHRLRHTAAMRIHRRGGVELTNRFLDHAPPGGLRTTYGYLDNRTMPDDIFMERATEALGAFDDCPLPPPPPTSGQTTAPTPDDDEPPDAVLAPVP